MVKSNNDNVVAIVYDFDGTLSRGNIQEYDFIPSLQMSKGEFWASADELALRLDADSVLSYMERMITLSRERGIKLTQGLLREMGGRVDLFEGVEGWFERINSYAQRHGIKIQHYINSSGIKEMVEGTPIAHEFHQIYASSFMYDAQGEAYWPAVAINYTNKTQFIFKINKGIESVNDSTLVNEYVPREDRPIPFSKIIFIGDGMTDVPSMRLVHSMGGHAIALFDPNQMDKYHQMERLIDDGRVNYLCAANYQEGSPLDNIIKGIIDKLR